ncbi:MAG: hypothetical protein B7Y45_07860 [Sphingomonas sp. 28-66-16]|nr:MAG: hypothetical protein B7Y45_07860 [Sphingomonas sp. 28-66-16]
MATLVLTAIGSVFGGPIGAALGGLVGQAIDAELFKPQGREGPRLTELAVQTSSYGTPIPKVFGTMRVAGSVIWSTDLIERSDRSGGGKGQPSLTRYSYSASFAVLLSGRAISGVGRIWADGSLLRGASGDFKTSTRFRLHLGGEAQTADPLIASAEGAMAPAHRGLAYAVFEHFELADYGNRIPSLTFELIADEAPVAVGVIAETLARAQIDGSGGSGAMTLAGFSAYGDSLRGVLETLATISGGWFAPNGARLILRGDDDASLTPSATIVDPGFAASGDRTVPRSHRLAAIDGVPRIVSIGHYDPDRDYQAGLQRARRPAPGDRHERIDVPAVIDAVAARRIAEAALARAEAGRQRRDIALSLADLAIAPGACVAIAGEAGRWRVTRWSLEAMVVGLELIRLPDPALAGVASSGRVLASPDLVAGATILHAFELPALDDAILAQPRVLIAAAGAAPGWRRAALLLSTDEGARWSEIGATARPAVIGALATTVAPAPATLRDLATVIEVTLAHAGMSLSDADDAALDAGANLALLGDELIQFGRAEPIDATRWRLSRLLRGRRGTEAAAGMQPIGARFVLIARDTVAAIDLPLAVIGGRARLLATGVGDTGGPVEAIAPLDGASVLPPAPAHLVHRITADGARVEWVRRSRAGWGWRDGIDAPLGEEAEAYQLTITLPDGAVRTIETPESRWPVPDDLLGVAFTVAVRQRGANGLSAPSLLAIG